MTSLVSQKGLLGSDKTPYEGQGTRSNGIVSLRRRLPNRQVEAGQEQGWPCKTHHHYTLMSSPSLLPHSLDGETYDEFCRFFGCKLNKKNSGSLSPLANFFSNYFCVTCVKPEVKNGLLCYIYIFQPYKIKTLPIAPPCSQCLGPPQSQPAQVFEGHGPAVFMDLFKSSSA